MREGPPRILIVEDDPGVAAGVARGIRDAGFVVELASTGESAISAAATDSFDLVVLDLMLPDLHGFDVLRRILTRGSVPVIVLTAQTELDERVEAFRLGAVDFVPKPFFIRELCARIDARLRIVRETPSRVVTWRDVVLDLDKRTLTVAGAPVPLTKYEVNILTYLATRPGRAVARSILAEAVLDHLSTSDERTIDSHVAHIRKKLGPRGSAIATVWGIGYRFDPERG